MSNEKNKGKNSQETISLIPPKLEYQNNFNIIEDPLIIKNSKKLNELLILNSGTSTPGASNASTTTPSASTASASTASTTVENIIIKELNKNPPKFRKSYSVLSSLTPFIKIYVKYNVGKKIPDLNKNFINIPYNFVKSLEIEQPTGSGADTNFTLKIEDPTGQVGILLTAAFLSSSQTKSTSNSAVPIIFIEFGWVKKTQKRVITGKGLNKISAYPSISNQFIVMDVDFSFTDKFKQELIVKGKQAISGNQDVYLNTNSDLKPETVLGSYPLKNLRIIQYFYFLQDPTYRVESYFTEKFNENIKQITESLKDDPRIYKFPGFKKSYNKEFSIINNFSNINPLFNKYISSHTAFNPLRINFATYLDRSYFNAYFVLCYFINMFKEFVVKNMLYDGKPLTVRIITLINEEELEIEDLNHLVDKSKTYDDFFDKFAAQDVALGKDKNALAGKANMIQATKYQVLSDTTWINLLQDIAGKVKFKKEPEKKLYVKIGRVTKDVTKDILLPSTSISSSKDSIPSTSFNNFISKISSIISSKNPKALKELKDIRDDFIYIVVSKGSEFFPNNPKEYNILQSYTVFPSHRSTNKIDYENFNSGSRTMVDEAYPDVISFSPKIKISDQANFHLSSARTASYLNSGILTIRLNNFVIEATSNNDTIIESLNTFIENYDKIPVTKEKKNVVYKIQIDRDSFYIEGLSTIKITVPPEFLDLKNKNELNFYNPEDNKILNTIVSGLRANKNSLLLGYKKNHIQKMIKKSENFSHGDSDLTSYYNFYNSANELSKIFQNSAGTFEGELKILGEPAFSDDWLTNIYILLKVNNFDGSVNSLLSGLYMVKKIKHIIENGKFETTLSLAFINSTKFFVDGFLG